MMEAAFPLSQSESLWPIQGMCSSSAICLEQVHGHSSQHFTSSPILVNTMVAFSVILRNWWQGWRVDLHLNLLDSECSFWGASSVWDRLLCTSSLHHTPESRRCCSVCLSHLSKWEQPGADGVPTMGKKEVVEGIWEGIHVLCSNSVHVLYPSCPPITYTSPTILWGLLHWESLLFTRLIRVPVGTSSDLEDYSKNGSEMR